MYFKITNEKENHYGFQYQDGLNVLKEPFSEEGSCVPGGLYFTDAKHIFQFMEYGIYLREVTLPTTDKDFRMVADEGDKWRVNKIILGKKYELWNVETIKYLVEKGADVYADNNYAVRMASQNGHLEVVKYLVEKGAQID